MPSPHVSDALRPDAPSHLKYVVELIRCPAHPDCGGFPGSTCTNTGHDFWRDEAGNLWNIHAVRMPAQKAKGDEMPEAQRKHLQSEDLHAKKEAERRRNAEVAKIKDLLAMAGEVTGDHPDRVQVAALFLLEKHLTNITELLNRIARLR